MRSEYRIFTQAKKICIRIFELFRDTEQIKNSTIHKIKQINNSTVRLGVDLFYFILLIMYKPCNHKILTYLSLHIMI